MRLSRSCCSCGGDGETITRPTDGRTRSGRTPKPIRYRIVIADIRSADVHVQQRRNANGINVYIDTKEKKIYHVQRCGR